MPAMHLQVLALNRSDSRGSARLSSLMSEQRPMRTDQTCQIWSCANTKRPRPGYVLLVRSAVVCVSLHRLPGASPLHILRRARSLIDVVPGYLFQGHV